MTRQLSSLCFAVLVLAGCQEKAPEPSDSARVVQADSAQLKVVTEIVLAGDLEAKGLAFLGGEITGLSAPSYGKDGSIAEGTPQVDTVYYGKKGVGQVAEAKQYACEVPEQFRNIGSADSADRAKWKCRKING